MLVRPIDPSSTDELHLVASRMRQTLVEVLGEEKGGSMYTMDWLIARAAYHVHNDDCASQIFLAESESRQITGHTIVRIDRDENQQPIGLFSTTYVIPEARRDGVAKLLISRGEDWMREQGMTKAATYTDEENTGLQNLFLSLGYIQRPMENNFVELSKAIG